MFKIATRTTVAVDLNARRAELSAEHHHLTLSQQEMVATEALRHVDASLACAGLTSDEPTGRFYLALAQRVATPAAREGWLRLSTLQSACLKTPIMCALAATLESGEYDRASAVQCAIAHSGGTITPSVLRAQLQAGPQRWHAANAEVAAAQTAELRCAWQIVRLASHDVLLPLLGAPKKAAQVQVPQRARRSRTRQREASTPAPQARPVTGRGRLSHGPRIDPAVTAMFAA
jgi:hypothetical protein